MTQPLSIAQKVEIAFRHFLPGAAYLERCLADAVDHVLAHPGNLVRAHLACETGLVVDLPESSALALAVAVEYFHTASLLFDDLPAMDDARERRGHACTHVVFGEAAGTLTALAFVNRAYALLWQAMEAASTTSRLEASALTERCLGLYGMLNGQSLDLHGEGVAWTPSAVLRVSMGKTVCLIHLALVLPAVLGGASPNVRHALHQLGVYWGLSYQILDDLKDVCLSGADTGKTSQRDAILGRANLALTEGVGRSFERVSRLVRLSDRVIRRLEESSGEWRYLWQAQQRFVQEMQRFEELGVHAMA